MLFVRWSPISGNCCPKQLPLAVCQPLKQKPPLSARGHRNFLIAFFECVSFFPPTRGARFLVGTALRFFMEVVMFQFKSKSKFNPSTLSLDEQLRHADFAHFKDLQTRIDDFTAARLIVDFLDQHPSLKTRHMGVYLRASESVQRYRIRCAKRFRAGRMAGTVVRQVYLLLKAIGMRVTSLAVRLGSSSQEQPQPNLPASAGNVLVCPTLHAPNEIRR